jgi:hypothetical protein
MGKSDEDLELERIDAESSIPDLYGCAGWTLLAIVVLGPVVLAVIFLAAFVGMRPPV